MPGLVRGRRAIGGNRQVHGARDFGLRQIQLEPDLGSAVGDMPQKWSKHRGRSKMDSSRLVNRIAELPHRRTEEWPPQCTKPWNCCLRWLRLNSMKTFLYIVGGLLV